ncbi:restriction endonuclease subunit S [Sphingosinicella humi]|uniref:Type I restriction modification DNA specificity domain-containing protein n=1 Tax=Allosphingosinicella humi TaxID=2068657 RepID=A0A2U2J5B0_9SPHN|nr:restriction endonuclease subunit S [Sphingosinicella humi]PWG03520.1 hypothetical protein DF286_12035 [Sphingosinicella humi]
MVMALAKGKTNTDFKQSEVGSIPTDWSIKLLPEVCRFRGGKAHEQFVSEHGKYVCVNSKFISTDGAVRKFATKNFCPAKRGDILMVMSDLPNGKALAKTYVSDVDDLYAVNQRVCSLTPYRDDSKYLAYALNRNRYFLRFDDGVSQTHLLNPVFQNCPVVVPSSIKEQQAIAAALSDADALIEGLESLLAKKRAIKQGAMQELLSGRRRLPGFSCKWEEATFAEVFAFLPTATNARDDLSDEGDAAYVHYGDIHTRFHEILDFSRMSPPRIERHRCPNAATLKNGDWIMADASEDFDGVAKSVEVTGLKTGDVAISGLHTFLLREKKPTFAPGFKGYLGNAKQLREQYLRVMTGMKVYAVSKTALCDLVVPVPERKEQEAIRDVLNDMSEELIALEGRLAKARQIKQGMMRELLTGRVRLV